MKTAKRILALMLCSVMLIISFVTVKAESLRIGIDGGVNIRSSPGAYGSGSIIFTTDRYIEATSDRIENDRDGDPWYHIILDDGRQGYVYKPLATVLYSVEEPNGENPDIPETPAYYVMTIDTVNVRESPSIWSASIAEIWPCRIGCYGTAVGGDGYTWYKILTPGGLVGYIRQDFIELYTYTYDEQFEKSLSAFPESYHDGLRHLHTKHPEWKFYADNISVSLTSAVENELGKKLISNIYTSLPSSWREDLPSGTVVEPGYRYASKTAIRYAMDPTNFLVPKSVFMFLQQSFDPASQTAEGVKVLVKETFLDRDDYINYIMEAGSLSGVSPYILATTIINEQSRNGSDLSLGNYPGYEGYYNFFNFSASGATYEQIITNGLTFAKSQGWNTPRTSIIGGAVMYGNNYVNVGQYTYYYKDYNVVTGVWYHQYATNIFDHINNAKLTAPIYDSTVSSLSFRIPVFSDADLNGHSHYYGGFVANVSHHWRECQCGGSVGFEIHKFNSGTVIKEAELFKSGLKSVRCTVCGYERTVEIPSVISYYKTGNTATIVSCTDTLPSKFTLPETIDGAKITEIAPGAFASAKGLEELTVRKNDLIIGNSAIPSNVDILCNAGGYAAAYCKQNGNRALVYGSIDGDATVTAHDAELLAAYISGTADISPDIRIADLNGDGKIDVCDCVKIMLFLKGKITEF